MKEIKDRVIKILGVNVFRDTETRKINGKKLVSKTGWRREEFHKAPTLPPELEEPFASIQAAITSRLMVEGTAGEYPFKYGDMGGSDVPLNSLNQLSKKFTDVELAHLYIKRFGTEEAKNDADYENQVIMAIGSIRGATPLKTK